MFLKHFSFSLDIFHHSTGLIFLFPSIHGLKISCTRLNSYTAIPEIPEL